VATVVEVATRFRLLLDSNVLFAAEPFAGRLEPGFSPVAELLRIASEQGHAVLIHPASLDDAREDKDLERRRQRLAELGKYACLRETPILPKLAELFGSLRPGSNDARDLRILSALPARAATHLVTDDNRLRRRAARAGFGAAVSTVGDTLALLRDLVRPAAEPPPRVRELLAYEVDGGQSIFASLRLDYPEGNGQVGFDTWLDKVRADPANRKIFAVIIDGAYQAVAILKLEEDDRRYGFPAGTTKIATLKVHDDHGGSKLGELLLKAVLSDAHERGEVPRVSRTVDTITPLR
jgi:GNAT superfamily N-acetyltransferase